MKKRTMSDIKTDKPIRQPLVWPQYWNKRINEEIQMRADKINNLLVIYEGNMLNNQQERNIGKNYI